jgi:hypothetical protein
MDWFSLWEPVSYIDVEPPADAGSAPLSDVRSRCAAVWGVCCPAPHSRIRPRLPAAGAVSIARSGRSGRRRCPW